MAARAWLADALVVLGVLVMTMGVYGVYRMPDIYTRLHAASKSVVLGVVALLGAVMLAGQLALSGRAAIIAGVLLLTTPVTAHVIARSAYVGEEAMEAAGADEPSDAAERT